MKRITSMLLCVVLLLALCPTVFAANEDYAAFYLTEYQVQAGDTLSGICDSRGISYPEYATIIKNVNGIANPNALVTGRTYWLPTKTLGQCERYYTVYRHVLVSGDTISGLCGSYKTSTNAVGSLIQSLNGVSSLNGFMANTNVYIPVPSAAMSTATTTTGTTATTTPATTTTTTTTAATTTASTGSTEVTARNGDYLAFYITPYLCQSGDTLQAICNSRGVKYDSYKDMILRLNKLASVNSLIAGRSYWMPASTKGSSTVYYAVYAHLLRTGDTMYALCNGYGINMKKYTELILKLNNVKSLNGFMANRNVLLPVYHDGGSGDPGIEIEVLDETQAGVSTGVTTTTTETDANGNPVTVTTTTSTTVQEADGLFDAKASGIYYLVPHTVASGESVISICNDMGSSFSRNKDLIVGANELKTYTLTKGEQLYIPAGSQGNATRYYKVVVKTVNWGDTVYGYYAGLNADFSSNYKMLTALNSNLNFNNLKVGDKVSVPVFVG